MSALVEADRIRLDRIGRIALAAGIVCLLPCVIATIWEGQREQFFRVYLTAFQFVTDLALGCWVLFMIYFLTGGAWGWFARRIAEAGMRTLPLTALLFIPVGLGLSYLYPWAQPEMAQSPQIKWSAIYLNPTFWWIRAILFFALWIAAEFIMSRWSRLQDETGDPTFPRRFRLLSAPCLIMYGVTITFASVDWLMSIQPKFHSTMFGPLYASNQILSSMSFVLIVLGFLADRPPFRDVLSVEALRDMGSLLFAIQISMYWK